MPDVDFYNDMQATAVEMLEEFGRAAVVTKQIKQVYKPSTGKKTSVPETKDVLAVVYPFKRGYIDNETGSTIFRDVLSAIVGSKDTTLDIAQGDKLVLDGRSYVFEGVNKVSPGGIDLIFIGTVSK